MDACAQLPQKRSREAETVCGNAIGTQNRQALVLLGFFDTHLLCHFLLGKRSNALRRALAAVVVSLPSSRTEDLPPLVVMQMLRTLSRTRRNPLGEP